MTAFETVTAAWKELQKDSHSRPGTYERRIYAKSRRSLFAGIKQPSGVLQLFFYVSPSLLHDWVDVDTRGFVLRANPKVVVEGAVRISFEAVHSSYADLFGRLCADVIEAIIGSSDDAAAIEAMRNRIAHWRHFLRRAGMGGLSEEAQAGLYGELLFLKSILDQEYPPRAAIEAWKGPFGANQDFQFGGIAVEVKTVLANVDTVVTISNERQLDDTGLQLLALCSVSLDRREHVANTLPELVRSVVDAIEPACVPELLNRLLAAGYHDVDAQRYLLYGYTKRKVNYYRVSHGFPRIVPSNLMAGVREVKYKVDLVGASGHAIGQEQLFGALI